MYLLKKNELNKLLFKNGITRQDLADRAGISIETINSWMYRRSMATYETMIKVVNYFNIDIDDLFDEVL